MTGPEPLRTQRTLARLSTRAALAALAHAQKTSKGAPAYSRFINRRLGRLFAAWAYSAGFSPNHLTAASAACTFAGIGLLAAGPLSVLAAVLVASLLVLGYALDSADGQLARLQGTGSAAGEWLDHTVDAFKVGTIHLAVLVCWWRSYDLEPLWYLVPLAFQAGATVHFFATLLMDQLRRARRGDGGTRLAGDGHSSVLYSLAVLPTDFGLLCVLFLLLAAPPAFAAAYTLLAALTWGFLVLALGKWYREVRSWN